MARTAASARSAASARTALTYPRNPMGAVYVKGAKSIEGATGDTARTTTGWIENQKYGWYAYQVAVDWSAEFDTAVTRTGAKTVKLSTGEYGRVKAWLSTNDPSSATLPASDSIFAFRLKPSTEYTLSCWAKTTNAATNSVGVQIFEFASTMGAKITGGTSSTLTGTNDWTLCTKVFTTNASTAFGLLVLLNSVIGNISSAWFDVNSLTLIETGVTRGVVT